MIPLRDDIPSERTPVVNWVLIGTCLLVFATQATTLEDKPSLAERYGFIPSRLSRPGQQIVVPDVVEVQTPQGRQQAIIQREAAPAAVPPIVAMLTCTFLHGGLLHLAGNLWFLWIFGDNVEDRYGHFGYLVLYLCCGFLASACHYVSAPTSMLPTVGASGAIAGVMGAYLVSYPHARVLTVVPLLIILTTFVVPAPLFLSLWIGMQVFGVLQPADPEAGGVAWWAHIGGFAVGALATYFLGTMGILAASNRQRLITRGHRLKFR